ncbi:unnamed protein product [Darwinula stevensoni]|uniref:Fibronectin type-III domain-containing protein n=1 Tax=Darwinula stevensoni TaxID=69355 RepID=A0A7R9A4Q8_9CRUS|nr:unnamed protein product [Darwinula stevensoni]CAG0884777.1 unnamed protein product [Darwinula stevensoni]
MFLFLVGIVAFIPDMRKCLSPSSLQGESCTDRVTPSPIGIPLPHLAAFHLFHSVPLGFPVYVEFLLQSSWGNPRAQPDKTTGPYVPSPFLHVFCDRHSDLLDRHGCQIPQSHCGEIGLNPIVFLETSFKVATFGVVGVSEATQQPPQQQQQCGSPGCTGSSSTGCTGSSSSDSETALPPLSHGGYCPAGVGDYPMIAAMVSAYDGSGLGATTTLLTSGYSSDSNSSADLYTGGTEMYNGSPVDYHPAAEYYPEYGYPLPPDVAATFLQTEYGPDGGRHTKTTGEGKGREMSPRRENVDSLLRREISQKSPMAWGKPLPSSHLFLGASLVGCICPGPATVRMVSTNSSPPIPVPVQVPPGHMVQQIVDENGTLRHVILSAQPAHLPPPPPPHLAHLPPPHAHHHHHHPHHPPPPPHNPYGAAATAGAGSGNQFYQFPPGPYPGGGFGGVPTAGQARMTSTPSASSVSSSSHHPAGGPGSTPPPPPQSGSGLPMYHKDERTQKQHLKLRRKLQQKQRDSRLSHHNNNSIHQNSIGSGYLHGNGVHNDSGSSVSSLHSTPPLSPQKGDSRRDRSGDDLEEELEDGDVDPSQQALLNLLGSVDPPSVSEVTARSALLSWNPPDLTSSSSNMEKSSEVEAETASSSGTMPSVPMVEPCDLQYEVVLSDRGKDGRYKTIYLGPHLQCRLTDLKPHSEYFIRLHVLYEDLRGAPCEPASFITESCAPDAPSAPKILNRTKTAIQLRWNPPPDNGGKITRYALEWDEGQGPGAAFTEVFSGSSKQCRIPRLQPATNYCFRLAAANEFGLSEWSEMMSVSTSGTVPPPPLPPALVEEPTVSSLHLTWQRRPSDSSFSLQMEAQGSPHGFLPIYNGSDTSYLVENLSRNTMFHFRLNACNEEGSSRWSDVVAFKTLPAAPDPPLRLQLKGKVHAHSFRLDWEPPKDDGGDQITQYLLELDGGAGFELVYSGLETEFTCERLSPGTPYTAQVSCVSSGGRSEPSDPLRVTTLPVCPGQCPPPWLTGKPKAHSLHLKWAPPEYDGGSPVREYQVDVTSPDNTTLQAYRGMETECVVASLLPGRPYLFQVRAYNKAGAGPWSEPLEVVSGAGAPDAPPAPECTPKSPSSVSVAWEEPLNNGAAITEYRLEMALTTGVQKDEGADRLESCNGLPFHPAYIGPALSHDIKGLLPAASYLFRVQASNSAGVSPFSPMTCCTLAPCAPGVVPGVRVTPCPTSLSIMWREPPCNGAPILHYNVEIGDLTLEAPALSAEPFLVDDLLPETTYKVRVQAVNGVGVGGWSNPCRVTTSPLPPLPPRLECTTAGHNSLRLRWVHPSLATPSSSPSSPMLYTLEMENPRKGGWQVMYTGSSHSHKVGRLSETTTHRFRISASNESGQGPYSPIAAFTTLKAPPATLKSPQMQMLDGSQCRVEWGEVRPPPTPDTISYQLQIQPAKDTEFHTVYKGEERSYVLTGLQSNMLYRARVCAVRHCEDSEMLVGAYSPVAMFHSPPAAKQPSPTDTSPGSLLPKSPVQMGEGKQLSDQQLVALWVAGFTLGAILFAVIIHMALASS